MVRGSVHGVIRLLNGNLLKRNIDLLKMFVILWIVLLRNVVKLVMNLLLKVVRVKLLFIFRLFNRVLMRNILLNLLFELIRLNLRKIFGKVLKMVNVLYIRVLLLIVVGMRYMGVVDGMVVY